MNEEIIVLKTNYQLPLFGDEGSIERITLYLNSHTTFRSRRN